jgi:hypothetical protein
MTACQHMSPFPSKAQKILMHDRSCLKMLALLAVKRPDQGWKGLNGTFADVPPYLNEG